jgi:phosphate transport system substrate-binding protein
VWLLSWFLVAFDPRDPAAQFWVALGVLVVGIISLAIGVAALIRSRRGGKVLTYEIVSDVGLINDVKDLGSDLQVTLDGHPVNDARLIIVRLANAGSEAVSEKQDLHEGRPLRVYFNPPSLIRCAIHGTSPRSMIRQDQLKDFIRLGGYGEEPEGMARPYAFAELPGLLLNPTESVELKFLTRGRSELDVVGRIIGGKITEYSPPGPHPRRNTALVAAGVVLGALLAFEVAAIGGFFQNCALGPVPLNVNGSSAFYATARAEADSYHAACPVAVISVGSSSSGAGLHMLANGSIQVANSELSADQAGYGNAGFIEHRVALIVFSMIVNPSVVHVESLSRAEITAIYSGAITNWSQVAGGPNLPVTTVGRPSDSGTQAAFTRFVLQGPGRPPDVVESGTDEVLTYVSHHAGAIGYVDRGAVAQARGSVVELAIDRVTPTGGQVRQGEYPFWAIERMYTRSHPDGLSTSYIDHVARDVQTNDTFQRIEDVPDRVVASHG